MNNGSPRLLIMSEYTLDTHFFRNVGNGLRRAGYHVTFASMKDPQAPAWMSDAGFEYFWLRANQRWRYPGAVRRLSRIIRDKKIDILHAHLHEATLLGAAVKKLNANLRYVAGRHYSDQLVGLGKPWHVAMDRWATSVADLVTVPCKTTKQYMVRVERARAEKLVPVYIGYEFASEPEAEAGRIRIRRELGLDGRFAIGCVARYMRLKGHDHLLKSFQDIAKSAPDATLLMIGGGDWSEMKTYARDLGLEQRVLFTGFRRDVGDCIAALDVVVHPSLSEAFCQVIIESMGVGKAVVATTVGGAAEVITDGENGTLIPPADPGAIRDAVLRLYADPEVRARLAQNAKSVTSRFTVQNMVNSHIECYSQLQEDPHSRV